MWLNITAAALIGIFLRESPFAALTFFVVLIYHLWKKEQFFSLIYYAPVIVIFMLLYHPPQHTHFDWMAEDRDYSGEGRLAGDLNLDGDMLSGTLAIENNQVHFNYYLKSEDEKKQLMTKMPYFNRCLLKMEINHPLPNTNGLKFNYDLYLQNADIKYTGIVKELSHCQADTLTFIERVEKYRMNLSDRLVRYPSDQMKYMTALTLGDIRYLSTAELAQLKGLGIYHLYAISGSHVALISVQLYWLLKRCYLPVMYSRAVILIILPLYALLTGLSPSVMRAVLFIMIYLLCRRWLTLLDALCISFLIFIVFDPNIVFDIGFQLSYLLSFSLIFSADLIERYSPLMMMLITTFISQLITIPLLLFQFNGYQFIGFLTNLFFIPLFTFIIFPICTLALLFEMVMYHIPQQILYFVDLAFGLNQSLAAVFNNSFEITAANHPLFLCVVGSIATTFIIYKGYSSLARMVVMGVLFSIVVCCMSYWPLKRDSVSFIDVGQGDAVLIESNGRSMLIDTGGKMKFNDEEWRRRRKETKLSEQTILPLLKEHGIKRLDYMILTHPDNDHFGEAATILQSIPVTHLIINPHSPGAEKYNDLLKQSSTVSVKDSMEFTQFRMGNAQLNILNQQNNYQDENDSSIVIRLQLNHRSYLLMGDLPAEGEERLAAEICGPVDVLKVGHHGSDTSTSSALLNCTQPKYAVISAGRHNKFGHPHQTVIKRLETYGVHILNIQQQGMITFGAEVETIHDKIKTAD